MATIVAHTLSGEPIRVQESHSTEPVGPRPCSHDGDLTGLRVWEAATPLIKYLSRHRERLLDDRNVLELGAGTGAVGLSAAKMGSPRHVVLSDTDLTAALVTEAGWQEQSTLEQLSENVELNRLSAAAVSVVELRWGECAQRGALLERYPGGFDTVVASDVLYYPQRTYSRLVGAIDALVAPSGAVVLSYKVRHGDEGSCVRMLLESGYELVESSSDAGGQGSWENAARASLQVVELRRTKHPQ